MASVVLNGRLLKADAASLTVDDRGFLLGDGLFETMRAYGGKVFGAAAHLARLSRSAREFNLSFPWSAGDLEALISRLLTENELTEARVRVTVSRGRHEGAMTLSAAAAPTLLITAEAIPPNLQALERPGLRLVTAEVRFSEHNPIFRHKTLNRLPHLLARTQAERAGGDEALILDERGNVATASTGNLFAVHSGALFTPPLTGPILPGLTRELILSLAQNEGVAIRENFFSPLMLAGADEVFLTNSVQEIVPVIKVNERPVAGGRPGPLARRWLERYREACEA